MKKVLLSLLTLCAATTAAAQAFTPNPVTPPAGLKTTPMTANVTSESWNYTMDLDVNVGTYGSDFYIQGLLADFPDVWLCGSVEGDVITFPQGQFIDYFGEEGYSYELYACGYTDGGSNLCDFVLYRDAETGVMTSPAGMGIGEFVEYEGFYLDLEKQTSITITPSGFGEETTPVAVPEGLDWHEYNLSGEDMREGMVDYPAMLAFDGNDVYLTDFCDTSLMTGAAIKGYRSDEETIVFPSEQFLEHYDDGDHNIYFYGAAYDYETGAITTGDFILDYDAASDTYHSRFTGILISVGRITSSQISFVEFMNDIVLFGNGTEEDGISTVTLPQSNGTGIFTLDGRRAASLKGITINGRRVSINH